MNGAAWSLLLGPVLLLTALSGWLARPPSAAPPLLLDTPPLACSSPPRFHAGYVRDPGGLLVSDRVYRFMGVSWLEADICTPGFLTFAAAGQVAGGAAPEVQVSVNSVLLFHAPVSKSRSIRLAILRPGRVRIAYLNDYYLSEARVATLTSFQFVAPKCKTWQVIDGAPGQYDTLTHTASLSSADPLQVQPCADGLLSLRVVGRAGNNEYPQLQLRQGGRVLATLQTEARWQLFQQRISQRPLTISLTNPYFKELADRNLIVQQLAFTPTQPEIP